MTAESRDYFAVLDTETNWYDEVMSVGIAIADSETFELKSTRYYIITPECNAGGMYSSVLRINGQNIDILGSRQEIMDNLVQTLRRYNINSVFAYNALFDYGHLPELRVFRWFDIIKVAAYKQYNKAIPESCECFKTGRMKSHYGVEPIMRLLSGDRSYSEVHNALCDAVDELKIMELLTLSLDAYSHAQINSADKKSKAAIKI